MHDRAVLKIRAVDLIVVNGKWLCDYTNQGMSARHRALDRGYRGSHPPQPRDQSLHCTYTAPKQKMISVRSAQYADIFSTVHDPAVATESL